MKTTFKHISQTILLMLCMFLLLSSVYAQSIVFSSDQWPKRWERAMHHQPMNGHLEPEKRHRNNFKKVSYREKNHQGWGQQRNKKRYSRSRTPEYNYQSNNMNPGMRLNNNSYSNSGLTTGNYGNSIPVYPRTYSGFGVPGYGMPGYGVPGYGMPGYGVSGYGVPGYGVSGYGVPGYGVPGYGVPGLGFPAPTFMAPGMGGYPW